MDILFCFDVSVKSSVPVLMYVEYVYSFQSHVWDPTGQGVQFV
jgi:hypothetical protein